MSIYEDLGLKRVINASGKMTALGVSTLHDDVAAAMSQAGQDFVVIDDLFIEAGKRVATYANAEGGCVTSSASAGIAMSVAGIISGGVLKNIRRLPDLSGLKNEILLPKGHCVSFGAPVTTMIHMGGGVAIEVGMANECTVQDYRDAISDRTAALMYIKSHHSIQKGMIALEDMIAVGHEHNIPVIVDAAAEEDLLKYVTMGADLVIYSGAKAFEAPSSGFVVGKKTLTDNVYKQYKGIGRPMKIGKEGIVGLLVALERYSKRDHDQIAKENKERALKLVSDLDAISGVKAVLIQDEAGREIYRAQVFVEPINGQNPAFAVDEQLKGGNPAIHTRSHRLNEGYLSFDVRALKESDIELITQRVKEIMNGTLL